MLAVLPALLRKETVPFMKMQFRKCKIPGLVAIAGLFLLITAIVLPFRPTSSATKQSEPIKGMSTRAAPQHQHAAPNIIDGAVHPELIQNKDAYRLFFMTVAADPNVTEDVNRQRAFLRPLLDENSLAAAQTILSDFKARYQAAVARYNASATAAQANDTTPPDIGAFLSERDGVVLSTKAAMEKALGEKVWAQFDRHVQKEKRKMKVAVEDHR